jgi:hypothetical protein
MSAPQDPLHVAELIIDLSPEPLGSRRLHLMMYLADAVHRCRYGQPLLVPAFEDRDDGPVSPRLEGALYNNDRPTSVGGRSNRLPPAACDSIRAALEQFARLSDDELLDWIDSYWTRAARPQPSDGESGHLPLTANMVR